MSDVPEASGRREAPCGKCSALAGFQVSHEGRQLVHSAFEMFLTRIAKYNDPHNEEWDWDDVTDKWERHAFAAFRDLLGVADQVARLREALRKSAVLLHKVCNAHGGYPFEDCPQESCAAARSVLGKEFSR